MEIETEHWDLHSENSLSLTFFKCPRITIKHVNHGLVAIEQILYCKSTYGAENKLNIRSIDILQIRSVSTFLRLGRDIH